MDLLSFDDVIASIRKNPKRNYSLLMGNGFSMAYDSKIFSYNALHDFLTSKNDELINRLFEVIKTKNFELIMQQLDTTIALLKAFGSDEELQKRVSGASQKLKEGLLSSIQELHPEHVYKIPDEKADACAKFLSLFLNTKGHVFTTNYDLLLYWVLLRQHVENPIDGFGRELLNPVEVSNGEEQEWSGLIWGPNVKNQNVHYLHGALHIFDAGADIDKVQYDSQNYLIDKVKERLTRGSYPIFVTAGNGDEKLEHIRHNRYLSHCFDQLSNLDGSLVTFGFNFGEYDEHIIEAINKAAKQQSKTPPKLWSVYIGVYSDLDAKHINSIAGKFLPKVHIFDAKTAPVWEI
ncbi:DUF4917 family protein [Ewingella americana]|uniref:DUF4917 family protein n=1 Tax=Ewingella americana TaxID=41202 RepID=UPI00163A8282|nr:DUF4917 family protein [Ewingella americana]QMV50805.1 DUF4917 family protein [Ewingella americana]